MHTSCFYSVASEQSQHCEGKASSKPIKGSAGIGLFLGWSGKSSTHTIAVGPVERCKLSQRAAPNAKRFGTFWVDWVSYPALLLCKTVKPANKLGILIAGTKRCELSPTGPRSTRFRRLGALLDSNRCGRNGHRRLALRS